MMFMPIVPALCRARGLDPVLAVLSVIAIYPATERSGLLQQTFSQLKESQFMCGFQFELSVASSRGASRNPRNTPAYATAVYDEIPQSHIIKCGLLIRKHSFVVRHRFDSCLKLLFIKCRSHLPELCHFQILRSG